MNADNPRILLLSDIPDGKGIRTSFCFPDGSGRFPPVRDKVHHRDWPDHKPVPDKHKAIEGPEMDAAATACVKAGIE